MKAVTVAANGTPVWSDVNGPTPSPNEVVIAVHAAGVNRADLLQCAGAYPAPPGSPDWLGLEVSGVIVQEVTEGRSRWRKGDRVCALLGSGGQAEFVAADPDLVMPVPEGYSFEQAAALPEAYATAWLNLVLVGGLEAGQSVLVTGATSGVAEATIRTAKALGARVLGSVRRTSAVADIEHLECDAVLDTSVLPLHVALRREREASRAINLVIDCVGGPEVGVSLAELATEGRWIALSGLGGAEAKVDLWSMLVRRTGLIGSSLRSRETASKALILRQLEDRIWPYLASGAIPPPTMETFDIRAVKRAHETMEAGGRVGKIVLTLPVEQR